MKSYFFIFLFLFKPVSAQEGDIAYPYQSCNLHNIAFTKQIIENSESEAGFCTECNSQRNSFYSLIQQLQQPQKIINIPKECFLAMSIRGNQLFSKKQYIYCADKDHTRSSGYKKICVNKDYIDTIHKAFHELSDCFDFSPEEEKSIFALINQESGGILNVRSQFGARCLGQITKDYVEEINRYIKSSKSKNPIDYSEIYTQASTKCPKLENLVLKTAQVKKRNAYLTCQSTRDPYICLFYTFFGLKKNYKRIHDSLKGQSDYMGNRSLSSLQIYKQNTRFHNAFSINLNEMLNMKLRLNGKEEHWVFWDNSELYDTLKKLEKTAAQVEILEAEKTPIFKNDKEIETMFLFWSHNGGGTYSRFRMVDLIEKLKINIAQPCRRLQTKMCKMRQKIQTKQSLSLKDVLPYFEGYLERTYPSKRQSRRREVSNYARNVLTTYSKVFNYPNPEMINRYRKAFQHKKEQLELDKEDAQAFQQLVAEKCLNIRPIDSF